MSFEEKKSCLGCGGDVAGTMRFCPHCGKSLAQAHRGLWLGVLGTGLVFFAIPLGIKEGLTWKRGIDRPTKEFKAAEVEEEVIEDPQVKALKLELEANPMDIGKMRELAAVLSAKIRNTQDAPPAVVFETIDVLSKIVAIEPNDADALITLADISFDRKAFTKALDFYERYLQLRADDAGARARYASTLTFLGRYDQSIKELQSIIEKDPKNFPALAYLSITYAQSGAVQKAKEVAATALAAAPSDEARQRFSAFVASLESMPEGGAGQSAPPGGESGKAQGSQQATGTGLQGFLAAVKGNPVAGPKFIRHEVLADGTLRLFFREFPMSQMPPFAKEKFFTGLKRSAQATQVTSIKQIHFMDDLTGAEMETLVVAE
jgi:tetratricopeptide (TPR) repeat protein